MTTISSAEARTFSGGGVTASLPTAPAAPISRAPIKRDDCLEIWKDIPGYEGRYQASTEGRIRSVDRIVRCVNRSTGKTHSRFFKGHILRPGRYCKAGHLSVVLGRKENGTPVHQLIMKTFKGPAPEGMEVLHLNGNPADNRLENLRYGTRRENILDVYAQGKTWRKLSTDDVLAIRSGLSSGIKGVELATRFQVSISTISRIKQGRSFSWLE